MASTIRCVPAAEPWLGSFRSFSYEARSVGPPKRIVVSVKAVRNGPGQVLVPGGMIEDELDGRGQLLAVILGHLERAERVRIGVPAQPVTNRATAPGKSGSMRSWAISRVNPRRSSSCRDGGSCCDKRSQRRWPAACLPISAREGSARSHPPARRDSSRAGSPEVSAHVG